MERSLPPRRPRHPAVPVLQLELALGQPLSRRTGRGKRLSLAIVTVRRKGRLVMLWPLVSERVAGLKVLRWMGEPVSQYGDVLCESGPDTASSCGTAWQFIATRLGADAIVLRKVRADAAVAPLFREIGLQCTGAGRRPSSISPARPISPPTSSATAPRRARTAAASCADWRSGAVAVVRHTGGEQARAAALEAVALKRASLAAAGRLAPGACRSAVRRLLRRRRRRPRTRPAGCGVSVLESNGETPASPSTLHAGAGAPRTFSSTIRASTASVPACCWCRSGSGAPAPTASPPSISWLRATPTRWIGRTGRVAVEDFALGLTLAGRIYVNIYVGLLRERLKTGAEALSHHDGSAARARRW